MFTAIKINDENYKFKTGKIETEINGLNKINIFVGQNNSGKSRFMRCIFNKQNFDNREEGTDKYNDLIKQIKGYGISGQMFPSKIESMGTILYKSFNISMQNQKNKFFDFKQFCNNQRNYLINIRKEGIIDLLSLYNEAELFKNENYKILYIPMLRGLKNPIKNGKEDLYKTRVEQDNFKGINLSNIGVEIFTGLSLYKDIKNMLLGTHEKRENIRDFEKFLSKNFFQDKIIVLTPNIEDDVLYVKIGDNSDLPIYDLGDGIQSIIINTFPLFKYKDENLLLFIEEPEMGIHPGMQRILLNTFAKGIQSEGKEHQIYFTTHSNHFLDIALDKEINEKISIYQFKETENEKEKHITNISQNKEILDLLGVKNSSVFLSNCIIWVEGVSDRIYIKKFLELYQTQSGMKNFEEDKHFSIIEYAGGNITHFNFGEFNDEDTIKVDAINKNNFIVADNDLETSGKKFDRLQELKSLVGSDNIYFDFPEIENLITYDIYKKYFDEQKGKNWQIKTSRCWTKSTFESNIYKKNIGTILKSTFIELIPGKTSDKFTNGNDISIIGKKDEIAERLIGFMENYLDLSPKAKELTQKLYKFIEKNNI